MKTQALSFTFIFFTSIQIAFGQTVDTNFVDGVAYVKVADTSSMNLAPYNFNDVVLNTLYTTYDIDTITRPFPNINTKLDNTYRVYFNQIQQINNLLADFTALPYIEYAEKAPIYRTQGKLIPDDIHPDQYWINLLDAPQAWDITTGSVDIVVAVIDNAVSLTHEDLVDNLWTNPGETPNNSFDDDLNGFTDDIHGYDVADGDNDPSPPSHNFSDPWNHGTHVAGIAAARTNNGKGIASISYNIKYMGVKATPDSDTNNGGVLTNAYDGVYYAMQAGADIINISWGGTSGVFVTGESLINAAHSNGIVLIGAAGNNNNNQPFYPCAYNNVLCVGSTNEQDEKSGFSNYGSWVEVMAPGTAIRSAMSYDNTEYAKMWGTSMAAPMVSALSGLILSFDGNLTPNQVYNRIESTCENIDAQNQSYIGQLGMGRINAYFGVTGITAEEKNHTSELRIFPNPTKQQVNIETNKKVEYIEITRADGKIISTLRPIRENIINIDISEFSSGVYVVNVVSETDRNYAKLVVR